MKSVFIMRGLPGMGKSFVAEQLAKSFAPTFKAVICSADHYFIRADGSYKFEAEYIGEAHADCQMKFGQALHEGTPVVIVDNVNYLRAHMEYYKFLAEKYGYRFTEILVGDLDVNASFARNTHGVPKETLERMARSFER